MQRQRIAMSFEAFERLPRKPGWKYEYFDGQAAISPNALCVVTTTPVEKRPVRSPLPLCGVEPVHEEPLIDAYVEAFKDTVEYCDWAFEHIEQSARQATRQFFEGSRGVPHPASRMAVVDEHAAPPYLVGAALIRAGGSGPVLDLLFVRPRWRRQGLATALVASAFGRLHDEGARRLTSLYRLANEASLAWHRSFGFVEEPDLRVARVYLRCSRHALWHAEQIEDLDKRERVRLEENVARWRREVGRLEQLADEAGIEAVLAFPLR